MNLHGSETPHSSESLKLWYQGRTPSFEPLKTITQTAQTRFWSYGEPQSHESHNQHAPASAADEIHEVFLQQAHLLTSELRA